MPHFDKIMEKGASVCVCLCSFKSWKGHLIRGEIGLLVCCLFFIPFSGVPTFAFFNYNNNPLPNVIVIKDIQCVVDTGCLVEVLPVGNHWPPVWAHTCAPTAPRDGIRSFTCRWEWALAPRPKSLLQEKAWSQTGVGRKCQSPICGSCGTWQEILLLWS